MAIHYMYGRLKVSIDRDFAVLCITVCKYSAGLTKVFDTLERNMHEFENERGPCLMLKKFSSVKLSTCTVKYTLMVKYTQNYAKMPVLVR